MVEEVPVVIVGGGPIGLTLSCILGKNNIEHVLLEKNDSTSNWPKAMLTNPRSMELYHQLVQTKTMADYCRTLLTQDPTFEISSSGIDTLLREEELVGTDSRILIGNSLINEKPILQVSAPAQMMGKNSRRNPDSSYTFDEEWTTENILRLSQIYIEPILKKAASEYASSEIMFGWQVQAISQNQDQVTIEAVNGKSGERKVYHAQYAVGCDGGKSFVRKSLGIHFKGQFDLANMKSISYESQELKERFLVENVLGAITVKSNIQALTLPLNKEGLFVSHLMRYEGELRPEGYLKTLLDNEDISCNVVFANDWQGHFASAETLQQGRVFLAGDACHVMVPIGGFGMNTGVLDAYDLGWKLVATLNGWGGEKLLASYTAERLPFINKVLDRIRQMFYMLQNYSRIFAFLIGTRPFNFIMRRLFDIDASNLNVGMSGILFGLRLESSPLCIPCSIPLPPEDPASYTPTALPGCRAPHYQFDDGSTLYDKLGSALTLLYLKPSEQNYDPLMSAAAHCGIPLKVVSLEDEKLKTLYRGMDFVLIRPDLYIAWCGNEIPTLLHNENVNEGAKVLMKVVTGAASLPLEWQRSSKNRHAVRTWRLPLLFSLLVGTTAVSVVLLRRYKWLQ